MSSGRGSGRWAASKVVESKDLEKIRAEIGAELGKREMNNLGKVKVERAILSNWTPLDDSV